MAKSESTRERDEELQSLFRRGLAEQGFEPVRQSKLKGRRMRGVPRRSRSTSDDVARLVEHDDGVLRWQLGDPKFTTVGKGRRASRAGVLPGRVVDQFEFQGIQGSEVAGQLDWLDKKLTPQAWRSEGGHDSLHGLRRIQKGSFTPAPDPASTNGKRVFLFIHGTFSNCNNVIKDLKRTKAGRSFLGVLEAKYDYVLTFDHPTLSVSPALNAFDLAARLRAEPKQLDIVCHSRGGLVARWFCEAFAPPRTIRRVVFVGSPLAGTSLAAAPRIRNTCNYLSNLASMGSKILSWLPGAVTQFIGFLLKMAKWVAAAAAKLPLFDAAMAMIPGLDAQAREGNNGEILRLRANSATVNFADRKRIVYHAISSDFQPDPVGWKFWRYFTDTPLLRALNAGADVVFPRANDLVVDTASMLELADGVAIPFQESFAPSDGVHHCNYFRKAATFDWMRDWLALAH